MEKPFLQKALFSGSQRPIGLFVAVTGLIVLLCLAASQIPAGAAAYSYNSSGQLQTINVGFLMLDSAGQTGVGGVDHPGWYSFYILSQRNDIIPPGWDFVNPLAPKVLTADISGRYNNVYSTQIGQPITPNMAPYWEVDITRTNIQSLEQFNVLAIHTHDLVDLTRAERLLLRQYIDQGGTLWVEDCGISGNYNANYQGCATGPGFLFDLQFWNGVGSNGFAVVPTPTQRHPIITTPYFLSQDDMNGLGDKSIGNYFMTNNRGTSNTSGNAPANPQPPDPAIFTTVIANSGAKDMPVLSAGDYGSGHVVVDNLDIFDAINNPINTPQGPNDPPAYCGANLSAAPTQDLEVMVNIIAWATGTASTDGVDSRRDGQQLSMISGGVTKEWLYPDPHFTPAHQFVGSSTAAAIFGNIAYVDDNAGYLHAFDIDPPESLSGTFNPDDGGPGPDYYTGLQWNQDFSQGTSYDEIWDVAVTGQNNSPPLSAPTIANLPGVGTCVFVEADNGSVYAYLAGTTLTLEQVYARPNGSAAAPAYSSFTPALLPPAPAVYDGRLVAGQADGSVLVDDLSQGNNPYLYTLDVTTVDTTPVIAPPAVASIPNNDSQGYGGAAVVAYVTTQQNVWALLLGARDEQAQPAAGQIGYQVAAAKAPSQEFSSTGAFNLISPPEDPQGNPGPGVYYDNGFPEPGFVNPNYTGPPTSFIINPAAVQGAPPFYADYDITQGQGNAGALSVSRSEITAKLSSMQSPTGLVLPSGGVAVGPDNTFYMTVNEPTIGSAYIEAVSEQNVNLGTPEVIKWRFALVNTGPDASGITYSLGGYQFVGAPVVDGTGSTVYALAENATGVPIVLAFNTNAVCQVAAASGLPIGQTPSIQQTDEYELTQGGESNTVNAGTQFNYDRNTGTVTFTNFDQNPGTVPITPNLVAPLPVQITSGGTTPITNATVPMNTAASGGPLLRWWTPPLQAATNVIVGPLRKIGDSVYFAATFTSGGQPLSEIVGVDTALGIGPNNVSGGQPVSDQQIVVANLTAAQQAAFVSLSTLATSSTGATTAALAASSNFAVIQGSTGIEGFGYHPTLIADGNRLVSLGPSGNAIWSVDSTNQLQVQGGNLTDPEEPLGPDQSGTVAASKVSLNHPSSLSQIGQDDYLLSDTGNNRVVRLDTAGHVIWELTSFNDPLQLITPAATTTTPQGNPLLNLNQPTSATMWQTVGTTSGGSPTITYHYLIADSGNYRVVEVDDKYTSGTIQNPATDYHYLAWVSHTFDQAGRQYRYTSAQTIPGPGGTGYVLAGVANTQVAPLVAGTGGGVQLAPASQDSPGSSLLLLNYQTAAGGVGNGLPSAVISQVATAPTAAGYSFLPIRGLRSASISLAPSSGTGGAYLYQVVIADDDGAFAGPIGQVTTPPAAPLTPLSALPQIGTFALDTTVTGGWTFQQADYVNVVKAYDLLLSFQLGGAAISAYQGTPFSAASAVLLPSGDYLITNRGASGNSANVNTTNNAGGSDADFGGNVFEVEPLDPISAQRNVLVGNILGRPGNTSALSQPAFAIRPL